MRHTDAAHSVEAKGRKHLGTCSPSGGFAMVCRGQEVLIAASDPCPINRSRIVVSAGVDLESAEL